MQELQPEVMERLKAASWATPVMEALQEIADQVADWTADGLSDRAVDARVVAWLEANGRGYTDWLEGADEDGVLALMSGMNPRAVYDAFGYEAWYIECIRSIAFDWEPAPFIPWLMGYYYSIPDDEVPMLVAVMTPMSDLKLALKQIEDSYKKLFGKGAARPSRVSEVQDAKMLYLRRQGMSYREIAIQNLRSKYPDIIGRETRYRREIATEKERVAKAIPAVEKRWKERGLDSSIAE